MNGSNEGCDKAVGGELERGATPRHRGMDVRQHILTSVVGIYNELPGFSNSELFPMIWQVFIEENLLLISFGGSMI